MIIKFYFVFCFSFFPIEDYNSKIIKIDLFFVGFVIYYSINAIFFDDNTMHKIYASKGSFNLEEQLPKIKYSPLISTVLNTLLRKLALSNDSIIDLKETKTKENLDENKTNLMRNLKIKFILYFILSFICLLFFWYYISMFGAIYRNTQLHLLKDTLISFLISLISPFFLYLLPGLFRVPALAKPKKKRRILYNFSKIIQMF